jgi:exosortase/archaeosortase family protein
MAMGGSLVLNLIGIPVVQEGASISSIPGFKPEFHLGVEDACSGIQSLFALMMLSGLYGWFFLKRWPSRLVLFLCMLPMAVLGNLVRMVMLGIGCVWLGPETAVGRNVDGNQEMPLFHTLAGFAVFAVALTCMWLLSLLLERTLDKKRGSSSAEKAENTRYSTRKNWLQLGLTCLILGGGLAFCALQDSSYYVSDLGMKDQLPRVLLDYVSEEQGMQQREKDVLPEDVRVIRRQYMKKDRLILAASVLSGAEKRSLHSPDVCLPNGGWTVSQTRPMNIDLGQAGRCKASLMRIFRDILSKDGSRQRVEGMNIYFYLGSDGRTCADYNEHVLATYGDALLKNINHRWSMLSFFVIQNPTSDLSAKLAEEMAAEADAREFIRGLCEETFLKPAVD